MIPTTTSQPRIAHIELVDDVMSILGRGERALFDDLARATWDPRATLADLTGTIRREGHHSQTRAAA